jgi:hypothetical protein
MKRLGKSLMLGLILNFTFYRAAFGDAAPSPNLRVSDDALFFGVIIVVIAIISYLIIKSKIKK